MEPLSLIYFLITEHFLFQFMGHHDPVRGLPRSWPRPPSTRPPGTQGAILLSDQWFSLLASLIDTCDSIFLFSGSPPGMSRVPPGLFWCWQNWEKEVVQGTEPRSLAPPSSPGVVTAFPTTTSSSTPPNLSSNSYATCSGPWICVPCYRLI